MTEDRDRREAEEHDRAARDRVGLCWSCTHAARVSSSRGSTFYLCRLAETDPRFRRYPTLPVLVCEGYQLKR
jgi:hypothetical protein